MSTAVIEPAAGAAPDPAGASALLASRVEWAVVPRVNLLPPEILQARRLRSVKRWLAGIVIVVLVLLGAVDLWARTDVQSAQDALDDTTARTAVLNRQKNQYAQVPLWTGALDSAVAARRLAMAGHADWATFLEDLATSTPKNVTLTSLQISMPTTTMLGELGSVSAFGPLTGAGVGELQITGTAPGLAVVSTWLKRQTALRGLDIAVLDDATRGDSSSAVTFTTRIVITKRLLSAAYPSDSEAS